MRRLGLLVVVSCGSQKLWSRFPSAGPTPAKDAYTSPVFKVSRRYAEQFGERWVILSARYGFIDPDFVIAKNYNLSFYDPQAIRSPQLVEQVKDKGLDRFFEVAVLGSALYWERVVLAFKPFEAKLCHVNKRLGFPPVFIKHIRSLIDAGQPFSESK